MVRRDLCSKNVIIQNRREDSHLLNKSSKSAAERGKDSQLHLSEIGACWTRWDYFSHCPYQHIPLGSVYLTSLSNSPQDSAVLFCFILWRKWHSQHAQRLFLHCNSSYPTQRWKKSEWYRFDDSALLDFTVVELHWHFPEIFWWASQNHKSTRLEITFEIIKFDLRPNTIMSTRPWH